MYNNVSKSIEAIAKVIGMGLSIVFIIAGIIWALSIHKWIPFINGICLAVTSVIISFLVYGFGELIGNSYVIRQLVIKNNRILEQQYLLLKENSILTVIPEERADSNSANEPFTWFCPKCNNMNIHSDVECKICKEPKVQ